ncbi:MAG: hypothetical protein ACUVSF_09825 [Anaerolineae bacterium]
MPTLVIGGNVLVISREISEQLPGLIAHHLVAGGVEYPSLPGSVYAFILLLASHSLRSQVVAITPRVHSP